MTNTQSNTKKSPAQKATDLQITASNPAYNAWVSASAGSGKTKVLVQRVLRLLLNGVQPETVLAITYTKAAAAEMQNRITNNLRNWAVIPDETLYTVLSAVLGTAPTATHMQTARQLFARVLDTPGGIKIQTIHSFCKALLAQFPLESGVPVGFKVLEDTNSIIDTSLIKVMENTENIPYLQRLIKSGGKEGFINKIKTLIPQQQAFESLISSDFDIYKVSEISKTDTIETYQQQFVTDFISHENALITFNDAISGDISKKTVQKFYDAIQKVLQSTQQYTDIQPFFDVLYKKDNTGFSFGNTKILENNAHVLQPLSDIYQHYQEKCIYLHMVQNTDAFISVGRHFIDCYQHIKHTHNALDFDDIIHYTKRLFSKRGIADWVAYKTDKGHQHILLDESQDTSPQQWHILRSIIDPFFTSPIQQMSENPDHTIFVVGDDKQSIYSFQGADPQGFFDNKTHFQNLSTGAGYTFQDIPLAVSFRTVPAVLQWVDATMARADMTQLGTNTPIHHEAYRADTYGWVELLPVLYTQTDMYPKAPIAYAQEIAYKIQDILQKNTYLPSRKRYAHAGDILVLVKNRSGDFVNALIRTLNYIHIPVAGNDRLKLFADIAIQDIMALLQFSILPEDDLSLACVLKSPLVGMDDAHICDFAHNRGNKSLWHALRDMPQHADTVNYLQKFLNMADFSRPFEIINTVLNTPCQLSGGGHAPLTGRQAFVARLGGQVNDVIDELLQLSMSYEQDTIPTVQGLLDKVKNDTIEIKRDVDSGQQNQIRIMTIHGAKGLESPIVIIPDCYRNNKNDDSIIWNSDKTQFVIANTPTERQIAHKKLCITSDMLEKDMWESKRLLYVAMTRAEDILICGGYGRKHSDWCWYTALEQSIQDLQNHTQIKYQSYTHTDIWQSEQQNEKPYAEYLYVYAYNVQSEPTDIHTAAPNTYAHRDTIHIPDWAYADAPSESPTARPLRPSDTLMADTTVAPSPLSQHNKAVNDIYKRGNIMHQALENISFVAPKNRADILQRYLQTPSFALDAHTQQQYSNEILAVIDKYPFVFADNTRAEVPISGIVNIDNTLTPVNGIIDRLCVTDDTVWVIDFKSNRPPAENLDKVPNIYKQQLKIYGDLIAHIYPEKNIRTALLWTFSCQLLEIPR